MTDQAHDVSENRHGFVFKVGPELVAVQESNASLRFFSTTLATLVANAIDLKVASVLAINSGASIIFLFIRSDHLVSNLPRP